MTVINCTLFGNSASSAGGGISNDGVMVLTNCTISGNSVSGASAIGGGIDNNNQSGNLTLNNTIVAGNIAVSGAGDPDICGAVESISSSNLIGIGTADMTGISNGLNHNHVGTSLSPVNAELAPLANNGGATQTMAIAPGSLALDAGSNSLAVDANGNPLTADQPASHALSTARWISAPSNTREPRRRRSAPPAAPLPPPPATICPRFRGASSRAPTIMRFMSSIAPAAPRWSIAPT